MNHLPPVWRFTFGSVFLKWELVCNFRIMERISSFFIFYFFVINFLSQCVCTLPKLYLLFSLSLYIYIYSERTSFYIKYFVIPYSINVVSNISYCMKHTIMKCGALKQQQHLMPTVFQVSIVSTVSHHRQDHGAACLVEHLHGIVVLRFVVVCGVMSVPVD